MYREDKLNEVLERFPHMYNIDIGSNNEFLVYSILEEIEVLNKSIYDLASMLDIEKASGVWLDRLGEVFGIFRGIGESDDLYRINILQYWLVVSKNATSEIMIKFLVLIIGEEENLYEYDRLNGKIKIVLNKKLNIEIKELVQRTLLEVKATGIDIIIDFKYKIQKGSLLCGLFSSWNPHIWKYEEELLDRLDQIKVEETNMTKLNVHSLFQR